MKFTWVCASAIFFAASPAFGQAPVLSDSALNMTLPNDECLRRAEGAFRSMGYQPARYPTSIFADDRTHHLVIRCSHSHTGVIFLAGAGGRQPGQILDRLKDAFQRQR
jgi:hypothetical protein